VDLGAQDVFETNARMPSLVRELVTSGRPLMTTATTADTHLQMGRFDDVDMLVDLAACRRLGVTVARRPAYGGGTAFYQARCVATWSWMLPKAPAPNSAGPEATDAGSSDLDVASKRLEPILLDTLARLGLGEVGFEGSMDLRWGGRKLGAMPAQDLMVAHSVGGFVNLAPPDLELYLQIARVPEDKFADKAIKDMREYVVSAEEVRGEPLSYEEFRDTIVAASLAAGLDLVDEPLAPGEGDAEVEKARARMGSDEALRLVSSERFRAGAPAGTRVGLANHKGRKLCRAGVAIDGDEPDGTIVAAMMAGDMHVSPPDVLERVAAALTGARVADRADIRARIASVWEGPDVRQEVAIAVTTDDLLSAVDKAVAAASRSARAQSESVTTPSGGAR